MSAPFTMPTFKLTLSYDGSAYAGWQIQKNGNTIQAELERALRLITGQQIRVTGSGRTDAGVHAVAQVASATVATDLPPSRLQRALNGNLPWDIRVHAVQPMPDAFHALRDAIGKRYRYVLQDGPVLDVFHRHYAWFVRGNLDLEAMQAASAPLIGCHDFASFQAAGSPRASTIREVTALVIARPAHAPNLIWLEIEANGFLYNMVRNIVGTLVEVGQGKRARTGLSDIMRQKDRCVAGATAPAQGLFLLAVQYSR